MNRHPALFFACAIGFLAANPSLVVADNSYPMVCRGGGEMNAMYGRVSGKTVFSIEFRRALQGANVEQPAAGHCAWLDRALTPDEELELRYEHPDNRITNLEIREGHITVSRLEGRNGGHDLEYLIDGVHGGKIFNVQARRAKTPWGTDYLKITRVGP